MKRGDQGFERFGWFADWRAHRAARWVKPATGFVTRPEPRSIGSFARGKQLASGTLLFAGTLVEAPEQSLWDIPPPNPAFVAEAQGFAWLDDMAACDSDAARQKAQAWTWAWIARFGAGRGPGWTPDLVGRRVLRWIHNSGFLLNGREGEDVARFYAALTRQAVFLSRRWRAARPGLPRVEAATGLILAGLSLAGLQGLAPRGRAALEDLCRTEVTDGGGAPLAQPRGIGRGADAPDLGGQCHDRCRNHGAGRAVAGDGADCAGAADAAAC